MKRAKKKRFVVRKGGLFAIEFLQRGGGWGSRKSAARFSSVVAAENAFHRHHIGENFGVFPS